MRKRFSFLPTYHFEENTDGQIRGAAERVLRDCTIYGNCGKNLVNLDAGIDAKGVLIKNNDGTYKLTKQPTSRFSKIITVRIPANTRFVISYELIEYTGVEKYRPVQMVLKLSDSKSITVSPYNAESTNKKIYSTSWMLENDITAIQLYCEGNSAQPVGSYTVFKNFQIELGDESYSEGIDYESYAEVGDSDTESGKYVLPVTVSGKNLLNSYGYSTQGMSAPSSERANTNNYGTTISAIEPNTTLTVTQTKTDNPDAPSSYYNGHFCIGINSELIGKKIKFVCDIKITNNPLNVNHFLTLPNSVNVNGVITLENGRAVGIFDIPKNDTRQYIEIRNAGCSLIISNIMITEADETNTDYEPYTAPKITNLLLDAPLGQGESISCRENGLSVPELATIDPNITNYITFGSEVKPSSAKFDYYKY